MPLFIQLQHRHKCLRRQLHRPQVPHLLLARPVKSPILRGPHLYFTCSDGVNPPCAKVLLRKTLGRRWRGGSLSLAEGKKKMPPSYSSSFSTAINASVGSCTVPKFRIFFLPAFCFSSSFFFRVMSPP